MVIYIIINVCVCHFINWYRKEVPNEVQVAQFAAVCLEILRAHPLILGAERTAQLSGPVFSAPQFSGYSFQPDPNDTATSTLPQLLQLTRPRTFPRTDSFKANVSSDLTLDSSTTTRPVLSVDTAGLDPSLPESASARGPTTSLKSPIETQADISGLSNQNDNAVDDSRPIICLHCTHGYNRTGYFVVRFLVDILGMECVLFSISHLLLAIRTSFIAYFWSTLTLQ